MKSYELRNVKKYYGSSLVLDIPLLTLEEDNFYVVYGPNGAGKTTLLNLLAFLDKVSDGEIFFYNNQSNAPKQVTLIMQTPYLFKTTVFNNVSLGLNFRSISKRKIEQTIEPVLKQLGIWELRNRYPETLSEGEKKKVAIARAIVLDTKVLLMDELTANLDESYISLIENVISSVKDTKKTIIMTTHDLDQAYRLTKNILYIVNGKIVESPLRNMFFVNLNGSDSVRKAELTAGVEVYVATQKTGRATISIDPKDIIISREKFCSSALNSLKSTITGITKQNGLIDLVVDVKIPLHVFITQKSLNDMSLKIGEEVFITFKASAVKVF